MHDITQPQMRAIYKLAAESGLDNEALHEVVYHATGSTSIKLLSAEEAGRVIDRLRDCPSYPPAPPKSDKASDAQKKKLWAMMYELWNTSESMPQSREQRIARMSGLIKKVLKRENVDGQYPLNGISKTDIARLIKAVERYIENERRKKGCG